MRTLHDAWIAATDDLEAKELKERQTARRRASAPDAADEAVKATRAEALESFGQPAREGGLGARAVDFASELEAEGAKVASHQARRVLRQLQQ